MPNKGSLPDRQKALREKNLEAKRKKFSSHDILKRNRKSIQKSLYTR